MVISKTKPKNRQNEALKARCEKLTPFCSKLMKNRASRIPQKYQTLCRYMAKKCNEWNFLKYSFKISLLKLCQHKLGIKQNSILYEKRKKYFSDQVLPNGDIMKKVAQCGYFRIFLSLRFYVKSILKNLEFVKLLF